MSNNIENKAVIVDALKKALAMDIDKIYYAEQGLVPASFKGELQYVAFPSYGITLSGENKRYIHVNNKWVLETIPKNCAIFSESNAFCSPVQGAENIGVVLRPDFIRVMYLNFKDVSFENQHWPYNNLNLSVYYYHIYDSFKPATAKIIQTMELLAKERDHSGINIKLLKISLEMILRDLNDSHDYQGTSFETFIKILSFVGDHHLEDIGRLDVAKQLNISPSYISKLFKRFRKDENFSNYLINLRLDSAANLLRHDDYPIKEVAFRCAFNSTSYFTNEFKKRFAMTPAVYRRALQNEQNINKSAFL